MPTQIEGWRSWLQGRHYDKAPIKEAIIDIQIDQPAGSLKLTDLEHLGTKAEGYSALGSLLFGRLTGRLEAGQFTATTDQDHVGFRFAGGDGKYVASFRLNGFGFSRLAPYQTWEQFRDEARALWTIYREAVGSVSITRVGLRYVNQLDLPANLRDFRDYIRSYPEVSSDLPQQLAAFFMQVHVPLPDIGAVLVLNEAMVPPPAENLVSLLLDIDVSKMGLKLTADEEVWSMLEVFRLRKNLVFEGCITNTTRELIS